MSLHDLTEKWKTFVTSLNDKGIPVPLIRDNGKGSVSLTMLFVSFNLCVAGIIGKWSGAVGGINPQEAFNLFIACASLYFGRKLSKDSKGSVTLDDDNKTPPAP